MVKSQKGQSMVEYILLLVVVISLIHTIINSNRFKDLIGKEGRFATKMKGEAQWNYRHGSPGNGAAVIYSTAKDHPTYYNLSKNMSHFIGPKDPYP